MKATEALVKLRAVVAKLRSDADTKFDDAGAAFDRAKDERTKKARLVDMNEANGAIVFADAVLAALKQVEQEAEKENGEEKPPKSGGTGG